MAALVATVVPIAYRSITERLDDSPPLTAVVEVPSECPGGRYILPSRFDVAKLPPREDLDSAWVYEHDGADSTGNVIIVTLQGTSDDTVVLHGLKVIDLKREPPPVSSVVVDKCVGGGDLFARSFAVDLDSSPVQVVARSGDIDEPGDEGDRAIGFPYTISRSEPEVFWVTSETASCMCSWRLALDWSSGGRSGVLVLGMGSAPFRTASESTTDSGFVLHEDGSLERR